MSEYTVVPLNRTHNSLVPTVAHVWQDQMVELITMYLSNQPIYMRFTDASNMRAGSIGKVQRMTGFEDVTKKNGTEMSRAYSRWKSSFHTSRPITILIGTDVYEIDRQQLGSLWWDIVWDGRSNRCLAWAQDVEWLKDYQGPCHWHYGKKEIPQVAPLDRLGREIKVGDFTCYILHHFGQNYGASTQFGKVTKISRDGTVYAKNIALGSDEKSAEKKINDNNTIVILTKDLLDQLMLARLSTL